MTDEERTTVQHTESVKALGRVNRWLSLNLVALATIAMAAAGGAWNITKWAASVDASLKTQTQIMAIQSAQTAQLSQMNVDIQVLKATSERDDAALTGATSHGRER